MIAFLLFCLVLLFAWPLALLALAIWLPLLMIMALIRFAGFALGIAGWLTAGAAIMPAALASRRRAPGPEESMTLCANCRAVVVEHPSWGWTHRRTGAVNCATSTPTDPRRS